MSVSVDARDVPGTSLTLELGVCPRHSEHTIRWSSLLVTWESGSDHAAFRRVGHQAVGVTDE
jgi:hypothetical protein